MFLGTTLGCAFNPNINILILMRALQGFAREQPQLQQRPGRLQSHAWLTMHVSCQHRTTKVADMSCAGPAAVLLVLQSAHF
jgi:hypothetical protein